MPKELTEEDWAALAEALLPENVERTFRQEQQPERDMAILTMSRLENAYAIWT